MSNSADIRFEGLFEVQKYNLFSQKFKDVVNKSVKKSYVKTAPELKKLMRDDAKKAFKVKKQSFLKSFSVTTYDKKKNVLPALRVGSGVPFMGLHENGGVVRPRGGWLLIPVTKKELGPKEFKTLIANLIRSKNAYFKRTRKGQIGLYSKTNEENSVDIKRASGRKKLSERGKKQTLIAIGVKQVTLKKRLHTTSIIKRNIGLITNDLQKQFDLDFKK